MSYIGNSEQIDYIETFLLGKKNHHSIIFSGQRGIGKATAAKEIISRVIKKQNGSEVLNLKWIQPESKSGRITIDQIREISSFLNQTNFDGQFKFIVIDAADDLNVNSANSLLKPLEEPNNNCFFILINHSKSAILPTLKSRCIEFTFHPPGVENSAEIIKSQTHINFEEARKYSIISGENLGLAISLVEIDALILYSNISALIFAENFDFLEEQRIFARFNTSDQWKKYFFLIKRICYVLISKNHDVPLVSEEEKFLSKIKKIDFDDFTKFVEQLSDMQYKISNLYLNKRDVLHIILLKLFNLCQKTST